MSQTPPTGTLEMKLQWDEPLDDNLQGRWKQIATQHL